MTSWPRGNIVSFINYFLAITNSVSVQTTWTSMYFSFTFLLHNRSGITTYVCWCVIQRNKRSDHTRVQRPEKGSGDQSPEQGSRDQRPDQGSRDQNRVRRPEKGSRDQSRCPGSRGQLNCFSSGSLISFHFLPASSQVLKGHTHIFCVIHGTLPDSMFDHLSRFQCRFHFQLFCLTFSFFFVFFVFIAVQTGLSVSVC